MPFIRTFAPFVAGVAHMSRAKFSMFNVIGAVLWVLGICTAGYFFGNMQWVKDNLEKIIWGLILVPGSRTRRLKCYHTALLQSSRPHNARIKYLSHPGRLHRL